MGTTLADDDMLCDTIVPGEFPMSLRPDAGGFDYLGPFCGFRGNQLDEIRRRACECDDAKIFEPCPNGNIGEAGVDFAIEEIDDFGRRTHRGTDTVERTRLVTGYEFCNRRNPSIACNRTADVTPNGRN